MRIRDLILPSCQAPAHAAVPAGLYHFRRVIRGEHMRYHLRVDPQGPGVLIAGASEAVLLSPWGAAAAMGLLRGQSPDGVAADLRCDNPQQVVREVQAVLDELGRPDARYPIFNLIDPAVMGMRLRLVAPFQADVVANVGNRLHEIIDHLWAARIPHVRIHIGDETDSRTLVQAVTHAEDIGMIAGIRSTATRVSRDSLLIELAEAGLDYVVLPWGVTSSNHAAAFGADDFDRVGTTIKDIQRWEMTPVIDAALTPEIDEMFDEGLEQLDEWNVEHAEVFAVVQSPGTGGPLAGGFEPLALRQLAGWVEDLADRRFLQLIWLPPVQQGDDQSVADVIRGGPRAGGDVTVRVESDGRVIPPRGAYRTAGNLLSDPWEMIWSDAAFDQYRKQVEVPTRCDQCPGLAICAAACPADPKGWALPAATSHGT